MSAIRTAIRRAAISGECACNPARAVSVASVARFSSLVRAAPVARAAPVFPVRAFSSTPLRLSQKVQRDAWAANPIITYAELKPITQQPTDVSHRHEPDNEDMLFRADHYFPGHSPYRRP